MEPTGLWPFVSLEPTGVWQFVSLEHSGIWPFVSLEPTGVWQFVSLEHSGIWPICIRGAYRNLTNLYHWSLQYFSYTENIYIYVNIFTYMWIKWKGWIQCCIFYYIILYKYKCLVYLYLLLEYMYDGCVEQHNKYWWLYSIHQVTLHYNLTTKGVNWFFVIIEYSVWLCVPVIV